MNKWSKEEISLCKQVAEEYKKPIEFGGWYTNRHDNILLHNNIDWGDLNISHKEFGFIPLWTISDCLLWLDERYDDINIAKLGDEEWELETQDAFDKVHHVNHVIKIGKTPLEACLKAVLAVLEEK